MSTIEDFENAPVGATATRPGVPVAVKVSDRQRIQGNWDDGFVKMSPETLVDYDYALNPTAPTTAREALDLAWELAHPVKEGQEIPEGAEFIEFGDGSLEGPLTMERDWTPYFPFTIRTLDPLPDPEPDWLNARAVLADCDCNAGERTVYVCYSEIAWTCTDCDNPINPEDMKNVTPLYPEEGNEGMYVTGPVNIQLKDRNGQTVWEI